ncbi:hypothetical protein F8S09_01200 [Deinococcus sp. SDU3-2]|uniref:Uncharacterized protein n=1 Tax=Deinococcus terrestris TaxID=2651870 RepID=A0A7X1NTF6_9DEIO|nr:hypothetical protein [Deinococcus terrestris]MPY65313.1 hypothetical protein [Deinococcus terrestris]
MNRAAVLTLLALPLGYLLGWLLYGVPEEIVLLVVLIGAAAFAYAVRQDRGVIAFFTLLLTLGLGVGLVLGVIAVPILAGNSETLVAAPLIAGLLLLALVGLGVFRRRVGVALRLALTTPLAPWLWMAGILLFAFFPAVRVDCRGLQADPWMDYGGGFTYGTVGKRLWAAQPGLIPDRAELPDDFVVDDVRSSVTRCFQDAQGRPRPLSFRASAPLLVVHLTGPVQPGMDAYAAVFTPGDHRKLTPWARTETPYSEMTKHYPYLYPGWVVFPFLPELPPELERALKR